MNQVSGKVYPCQCDTPIYFVLHFQGVLEKKLCRYDRMVTRLQQQSTKFDLRAHEESVAARSGFELGTCPKEKEDQ